MRKRSQNLSRDENQKKMQGYIGVHRSVKIQGESQGQIDRQIDGQRMRMRESERESDRERERE